MSEAERRKGYVFGRVLVDAAKVLTPQFHDTVAYLTGGQLEMLRNMTQYLNRRATYVDTYTDDYYLVPDDTDWDAIESLVADLEEVLMGNPNTIFGFSAGWSENLSETKSGNGNYGRNTVTVPSGFVYVLEFASITNRSGDRGYTRILIRKAGSGVMLDADLSPVEDIPMSWTGSMTLDEGDSVRLAMNDCLDGDAIEGWVAGYKMVVPLP